MDWIVYILLALAVGFIISLIGFALCVAYTLFEEDGLEDNDEGGGEP